MVWSNDERNKVLNALGLHSQIKCPVCNGKNLALIDGYVLDVLQDQLGGPYVFGGQSLPKVVLICNICTHVIYFSAGFLGLLEEKEE